MITKNKLKTVHGIAHGRRNKVYNDSSLLHEANHNICKNSEDDLHKLAAINSTEEMFLTKRAFTITPSCNSLSSSSSAAASSDFALSEPPLTSSSLSSTSPTLTTVYNSVFVIFMPHGPRPLLGLDICYFSNSGSINNINITKNNVNDTAHKRHNTFYINNYNNNNSTTKNNNNSKNRNIINQSRYNNVNDKYSQLRQCVNRVHVRFDSRTHSELLYIPAMTSVNFLQLPRHHMHDVFRQKNEIDEHQSVSLTRQQPNLHTSYSERPFHKHRSSPFSYLSSTPLKQRQSSLSNLVNQRWQHLLPSCVVIIQLNVIDSSSSSNNLLEEMKQMSLATAAQHKNNHVLSQHTHQLSYLPPNKKFNATVNESISPHTFSLFITFTLRDTKSTYRFIASNTFKRLRISSHCVKFPLPELQITSHWYNIVFDLPQLHTWIMECQEDMSRNGCYATCNGASEEHFHEPQLQETVIASDTKNTKKFDSCNSFLCLSRHFSVEQINIEIAHGACFVRRIVAVKPNLTAELQETRNVEVIEKTTEHPCKINSKHFEKQSEQTEQSKHNLSHYLSLSRVEQLIPESLRLPLHVGSVKSIVVGLHQEIKNEPINSMQNTFVTKEVQHNKMENSQQDDTKCKKQEEYASFSEIAASLRTCLRPGKAEHCKPITSITSDASSESEFSIHLPPTHHYLNPLLENRHKNNNQTKYNNYLEAERVNAKCSEKQTTAQLVANDISGNENNESNNYVEAKGNDYRKKSLSTNLVLERIQHMGVQEIMARLRARISRINNVVDEQEWNDIDNTESRMSNEDRMNNDKHSKTTKHEELTLESEQEMVISEQENKKEEQSLHNLSDRNTIFVKCMSNDKEQLHAQQSLQSLIPPEQTNNSTLIKEEKQHTKFLSELSEYTKLESVHSATRKEVQEDELEEPEQEWSSHVEPELEVNKREVITTWARDVEKEMHHIHSQELINDCKAVASKNKEMELVIHPVQDNSKVNELEQFTRQALRRPVRRELTYSSMSVTNPATIDRKITLPSAELQNNITDVILTCNNNNNKEDINKKLKTAYANALVESKDVSERADVSGLTMYKTENSTNDKLPNPLQRSSFQFSDWLRLRRMREARAQSVNSASNDNNIQEKNNIISSGVSKKEDHQVTCRERKDKDCKLMLRRKQKITPSENDSVQLLTNTNISNVSSSSVGSDKSEADDKVKIRGPCAKQSVYSSKSNLYLRSNQEVERSTLTRRTCPYISARSDTTVNNKNENNFSVSNAIITATRKISTPCSLPLAKEQNEYSEETSQRYVNLEKSQKFIVARRKSQTTEFTTHDNSDENGKTNIIDKSLDKNDVIHKSTCSVSDRNPGREEPVNGDIEAISAFTITSTRLNHLTDVAPSPVHEWVNSFHLPVHLMQTSMRDVVGRYANMSTPSSFAPSQQTNMFTTTTTTNTTNADINKSENSNTTNSDVKHNMNDYNDFNVNSYKSITALCDITHASNNLEELRLEEKMAVTPLTNTHIVNKLQNEKHDDLHKANAIESSEQNSNRGEEYLTQEAYIKRNRVQPCKSVSDTWEIDKAANMFAFHYPVPQLYSESTTTCNESLSMDSGTQSIIDVVGSERMIERRGEPEEQ